MVTIDHVSKVYRVGGQDFTALHDISLEVNEGAFMSFVGPSGSGKTTLLKTIAGLLMPDSGTIKFEGMNFLEIPVWERNIAMVYQQFINYPHLNVFENIAFPFRVVPFFWVFMSIEVGAVEIGKPVLV